MGMKFLGWALGVNLRDLDQILETSFVLENKAEPQHWLKMRSHTQLRSSLSQ